MNSNVSNHKFLTTDLAQATYLIASGYKLIVILYEDRRAAFVFHDSPELQIAVDVFNSGDASILLPKYEFIRGNLLDRVKRGAA